MEVTLQCSDCISTFYVPQIAHTFIFEEAFGLIVFGEGSGCWWWWDLGIIRAKRDLGRIRWRGDLIFKFEGSLGWQDWEGGVGAGADEIWGFLEPSGRVNVDMIWKQCAESDSYLQCGRIDGCFVVCCGGRWLSANKNHTSRYFTEEREYRWAEKTPESLTIYRCSFITRSCFCKLRGYLLFSRIDPRFVSNLDRGKVKKMVYNTRFAFQGWLSRYIEEAFYKFKLIGGYVFLFIGRPGVTQDI